VLQEIGREATPGRTLFVLEVARAAEIPTALPELGRWFVCLLAWDAREATDAEIGAIAERLLAAGCVYAVCFGPDSERVHDAFDETRERRAGGPFVMTTWHDREPLAEAIYFSLNCATPDDEDYVVDECRSVIGIAVGSPEWAAELREAFAAPGEFIARCSSTQIRGALRRFLIVLAIIIAAGLAVPLLPEVFATIFAIGALFVGLPVLIVRMVDVGRGFREKPGFGRGARLLGRLLSVPQAMLGVASLLIGAAIIAWMLYNLFVERHPEFTGGISLGIGLALVIFGVLWVRQAPSRSGPRRE